MSSESIGGESMGFEGEGQVVDRKAEADTDDKHG